MDLTLHSRRGRILLEWCFEKNMYWHIMYDHWKSGQPEYTWSDNSAFGRDERIYYVSSCPETADIIAANVYISEIIYSCLCRPSKAKRQSWRVHTGCVSFSSSATNLFRLSWCFALGNHRHLYVFLSVQLSVISRSSRWREMMRQVGPTSKLSHSEPNHRPHVPRTKRVHKKGAT